MFAINYIYCNYLMLSLLFLHTSHNACCQFARTVISFPNCCVSGEVLISEQDPKWNFITRCGGINKSGLSRKGWLTQQSKKRWTAQAMLIERSPQMLIFLLQLIWFWNATWKSQDWRVIDFPVLKIRINLTHCQSCTFWKN